MNIGSTKYTKVIALDDPSVGNAYHTFSVRTADKHVQLCLIHFQEGPIKETGVNGVMNEDLLAMVIRRLKGFQTSEFVCRENAIALTKLEEAMMWLNKRTADREARGVEGTHAV